MFVKNVSFKTGVYAQLYLTLTIILTISLDLSIAL